MHRSWRRQSRAALVLALAAGFALTATSPAVAQEATITGRVMEAATQRPLTNAQVYIAGTSLGTLTDADGRYRLTGVPAGPTEVSVRLIGYRDASRTIELAAGGEATVDFLLDPAAISLESVVITATGEQRLREVGSAISTIQASEIVERTAPSSLTDLIHGRSTGVTILQSSGSVGTASTFKIRGNTSLGLDNTPVIYIDGARIDNSNDIGAGAGGQSFSMLNTINPEDIAEIEIVKGPAAAALYGTEASAGVVRITTKRGRNARTLYTFGIEQGWNWDPTDWWSVAWNPAGGLGTELLTGVPAARDTVYTLNLLDGVGPFESPFRTGQLRSYRGSIRGGIEGVTYYLSGEREDNEGNVPSNVAESYHVRGNFSFSPSENVTANVSTGFSRNEARLPENDNSLFGLIGNALGNPWNGPLTRPDPNNPGDPIQTCYLAYEVALAAAVPLDSVTVEECGSPYFVASNEDIFSLQNLLDMQRFTGSASLTYVPVGAWTNRLTLGYDESSFQLRNITPVDPQRPFGESSEGLISRDARESTTLTLEATSAFAFDLSPDVRSTTTVGLQYTGEELVSTQAVGRGFPAGSPSVGASVTNEADDFFIASKTAGVYVQEQIAWRDRLFINPAIRFDDNSAFGENLGVQPYPAINASYVISDEGWVPDFFEQLRLRAAWGRSGKQPGPNDALALLAPGPVTLRDGSSVLGVSADQPGNPDLKPETAEEFELGFDASMLEGRVGVDFAYYNKTTHDAIVARELAPSSGFPDERFTNVAELTNTGFEVGIDLVPLRRDDAYWNWRINFSTNDNEVTRLETPIVFGAQRHTEGFPFASYFDVPVAIDASGDAVVGDSIVFLGQPSPEWFGSVSSVLTVFDYVTLSGLLDFAGGHQLLNGFDSFSCGLFGGGGLFGACPAIFETTASGEFTDEAKIKQAAAGAGTDAPWVSDADYLRLRSLSLGFTLPETWVAPFSARSAQLNLTGSNLALWTKYDGTDPEVNFAGGAQATRQQLWTLPPARTFIVGLSVSF